MTTHSEFVATIDRYLTASGMGAARFGSQAVKDPNFVADVRGGRSPSLAMVERVLAFIRANPAEPARKAG